MQFKAITLYMQIYFKAEALNTNLLFAVNGLFPDIPLLQVDLFVEEHVGDHLEVWGVIGDVELVFAGRSGVEKVIFGKEFLHCLPHDFGSIEHIHLEIEKAADLVPDDGIVGAA